MKKKKVTAAKPRKAAASKPARRRAAGPPSKELPRVAPLHVVLDNAVPGGFRMEPV